MLDRHKLVTIIVLLLAAALLQPLFIDPAEEKVLILVEVRSTHKKVPQSLDVLDSNSNKLIGFLPIVLTLDDDVFNKFK